MCQTFLHPSPHGATGATVCKVPTGAGYVVFSAHGVYNACHASFHDQCLHIHPFMSPNANHEVVACYAIIYVCMPSPSVEDPVAHVPMQSEQSF